MRVKVHTTAPLPERRLLLPLIPGQNVADLARAVASAIGCDDGELELDVDGYALLPDSGVEILEPTDIVT
jgi:hypothetical protein